MAAEESRLEMADSAGQASTQRAVDRGQVFAVWVSRLERTCQVASKMTIWSNHPFCLSCSIRLSALT